MGNVFSLAIIYGAAGLGWVLFLSVPPVISTFLIIMSDSRVKSLKSIQQRIIDEWGRSVMEDSELDSNLNLSDENVIAPAEAGGPKPE